MSGVFRFEHPWVLYVSIPVVIGAIVWKIFLYKSPQFSYALAGQLAQKVRSTGLQYTYVLYAFRICILLALALLLAKPQISDSQLRLPVQGIDIMVVLDVSGSMSLAGFGQAKMSRFDVAKAEAIRFVQKREHDAIGLVIFGKNAVSRCPLTLDKGLLQDIVEKLRLGDINQEGTALTKGIVAAVNRLRYSDAKSKIMIVLTDGAPTQGDLNHVIGIEAAKKMGIKIYTIGIGSDKQEVVMDPFYGMRLVQGVNRPLLEKIATETGGRSFMAHNAADMRAVYDIIDRLEKTDHETPFFVTYEDLYQPYALGALVALVVELFFSSVVWFAL